MADLVLYTKDDCITYQGIETIEIPTADGGVQVFKADSGGVELQDYQNTSMTAIPSSAYAEVFGWKSAKFPRVTSIGPNAFRNCKNLVSLDFSVATSIGYAAFYYCSSLVTLILRASTMCELSEINPALLFGLGVTNQCYIYVPSSLVSAYNTAECWGLFSGMFRAIEDYPEICG